MKLIEVKSNSSCRRRNNVYQWNKIFIQPVLMFFISSWSLELSTSSSGPFVILGRRRKALGTRLQSSEIVAKLFLVHINDGIHWIYLRAEHGALFSVENIQSKQSFALCRKKKHREVSNLSLNHVEYRLFIFHIVYLLQWRSKQLKQK